jgi:hypothetical protein
MHESVPPRQCAVSGGTGGRSVRRGGYAKAVATRLRSLLRFLHVEGLTPNGFQASPSGTKRWKRRIREARDGSPTNFRTTTKRRCGTRHGRRSLNPGPSSCPIRRYGYALVTAASRSHAVPCT